LFFFLASPEHVVRCPGLSCPISRFLSMNMENQVHRAFYLFALAIFLPDRHRFLPFYSQCEPSLRFTFCGVSVFGCLPWRVPPADDKRFTRTPSCFPVVLSSTAPLHCSAVSPAVLPYRIPMPNCQPPSGCNTGSSRQIFFFFSAPIISLHLFLLSEPLYIGDADWFCGLRRILFFLPWRPHSPPPAPPLSADVCRPVFFNIIGEEAPPLFLQFRGPFVAFFALASPHCPVSQNIVFPDSHDPSSVPSRHLPLVRPAV